MTFSCLATSSLRFPPRNLFQRLFNPVQPYDSQPFLLRLWQRPGLPDPLVTLRFSQLGEPHSAVLGPFVVIIGLLHRIEPSALSSGIVAYS